MGPYAGKLEATDYAPGIKLTFGVCVKLHNLAVERGTYKKLTAGVSVVREAWWPVRRRRRCAATWTPRDEPYT